MTIKLFQFNPFQENTYILYDDRRECAIVDPGCSTQIERQALVDFISKEKLKPVCLINTHCHIDHVLGNRFVSSQYHLDLAVGAMELAVLAAVVKSARAFGIDYDPSPDPKILLRESDIISFGDTRMEIINVPGHSPGHIALVNRQEQIVIGGDVLFRGSIGRTDLPGGNHATLIASIRQKLFPLGDHYRVYPGHGITTTIGYERNNNHFLIQLG